MQADFDVDTLARYLHVTAEQVAKLADRGAIPARKVAGKWRFSEAEIHHWMESRMGLLDEPELAQVEHVLQHPVGETPPSVVSLAEMLHESSIGVPLAARTRGSVIQAMVDLAAASGHLWDPRKMTEAVLAREQLMSTAMDNGVALLHPRRPLPNILGEPILALGIASQGIPFGGSHRLTDLFFLIGSVDDRGHLRTLARLSRLVSDARFLDDLRLCADARQARECVVAKEEDVLAEDETRSATKAWPI